MRVWRHTFNKTFSKSFGGKRLNVLSSLTLSFSFRSHENDQFWEMAKEKFPILEWRQKLMWNTAASPPPPLTSIYFILYSKSFQFPSLWYNFALTHARLISYFNKNFSKSFGGKRLNVLSSMTLSFSFRSHENDQFWKWPKKNFQSWNEGKNWCGTPPPPRHHH